MKALAITHRGIEDICAGELLDIINVNKNNINNINKKDIKIQDSAVIFDVKDLKDLCRLCYKSQSAVKFLLLFDFVDIGDKEGNKDLAKALEAINDKIKKIDFSKWIDKENTFMVSCKRTGKHAFNSTDMGEGVGKLIINAIKNNKKYVPKVDLKNPDVIFFVFINNNKCYFGIDFCGFDMSKREYKIFNISGSIKGTIAYALVRLSGFRSSILDPMARAGVMCIESALWASGMPVNYYKKKDFAFLKLRPLKKIDFDSFFSDIDKKIKKKSAQKIYCYNNDMRNVQAAKKNAKVAGVQKLISFGKVDLEWLDTKFEEGEIQSMVSVINFPKTSNISDNKKFCEEFFYQSEFILDKKGKIVVVSNNLDLIKDSAKKHNFKVLEQRSIFSGEGELKAVVFKRH